MTGAQRSRLDDGAIRRNPCRDRGAGQEASPKRPTLTIAQVYALADATNQRYRALVLLAMFTSLRWSELGTLRRCDVDPAARTVSVSRQLASVRGGGFAFGSPKSRAGKRMVTIPEVILPVIQWHLACFAQEGDEGLVFTSPAGQPLHHSNFRRRVWLPALGKAGLPAVHFHDLRHTGNSLVASAGAILRELLDRMGHDSQRAAMVYLHGSAERQHQIADTLSKLARRTETRQQTPGRSGRQEAIGYATGTNRESGLMKIICESRETASDLAILTCAPSATRTRDLLLRRHNHPSAVQTSKDARHQRAKPPQAVAL